VPFTADEVAALPRDGRFTRPSPDGTLLLVGHRRELRVYRRTD
jgi:hypothetical protein